MRLRAKREPETQHVEVQHTTMHESVPDIAFELALYRMRFTPDSTSNILNDYLRELGA